MVSIELMQLIFKSVSLVELTLLFYSFFSTLRLLTELTWLNRVLILVVVVAVCGYNYRREGECWDCPRCPGMPEREQHRVGQLPNHFWPRWTRLHLTLSSCYFQRLDCYHVRCHRFQKRELRKEKEGEIVSHTIGKPPPPLLFPYQSFESPQVLHLSHDCCCTLNRTFHWFWFITKDSYTLHVLLRQAFVERKFILQILYFYHYIYSSHSIILFMMHFEYSCCTFGFQPFFSSFDCMPICSFLLR